MLNELGHIETCLGSFASQTWPLELLDVMVIDGGSDDGSRDVVDSYASVNPWVRIVENPVGSAACAFNLGMTEARGEVVCLFSAHGVADPDYVRASVEALHRSGASGVGGGYRHEGTDAVSAAIGIAMISPVGMASPHRYASEPCDVDTISHPAYWRDAMLSVGRFDEALERNSDYEFNHRMREGGHRLRFDPSIGSVYRPRPGLRALARQFWHYGRWKARVMEQHPSSVRPRHLVPPLAVLGLATAPFLLIARPLRPIVALVLAAYGAVVGVGVGLARPRAHGASVRHLAAAFPVMHLAWGAGVVTAVLRRLFKGSRT